MRLLSRLWKKKQIQHLASTEGTEFTQASALPEFTYKKYQNWPHIFLTSTGLYGFSLDDRFALFDERKRD